MRIIYIISGRRSALTNREHRDDFNCKRSGYIYSSRDEITLEKEDEGSLQMRRGVISVAKNADKDFYANARMSN